MLKNNQSNITVLCRCLLIGVIAMINGNAFAGSKIITDCKVVAHRGFSYVAPENTIAAINRAIAVGANGSEFDVYACASGEIVLMHDSTVDRTTDGAGSVSGLTLSQLKSLDASYTFPSYAGERVPTMNEALASLKDSGTAAVCEIKQAGIAAGVVSSIINSEMLDQTAVISFNAGELSAVHAINADIPTGLLLSSLTGATASEKAAQVASQVAACDADFVNINYSALSREIVEAIKDLDVPVWSWTADNQTTIENLYDWGVVSVTTNRPDLGMIAAPEPSSIAMILAAALGLLVLKIKKKV